MGTFYQIVLSVLGILLVLILVTVGYTLRTTTKKRGATAPVAAACPDFWTIDASGNCVASPSNKGSFSATFASFQGTEYKGDIGLCNKRKWADQFNVAWDGISYGGTFPCA